MNTIKLVLAVLMFLGSILAAAPGAMAHTRSESHETWLVDGSSVHLTFTVSDVEAARVSGDRLRPSDRQLIDYLSTRVGATAGRAACTLAARPRPVTVAQGFRRVEFFFECPSPNGIVLRSTAFFDLVPTHVTLAQIENAKGDFAENVLTANDNLIDMGEESGGKLEGAGFFTFVEMGIMHILTGVDHMSFLLGLVLISRRFRDLAFVITGFTLGHSLTLGLSVAGIIRPHAEFIDALVALTIALIGIENIAAQTHRTATLALSTAGALFFMALLKLMGIGLLPVALLFGAGLFASNYLMVSGYARDAAKLRLVVTLLFGLIHGFGFAADLLNESIPRAKLAELLAGFNLGVELGQLTVVGLLTLLVLMARRLHLTLPRPVVVDLCASLLVMLGTYWFISRSFGPI
jgi:hypothetical protein